MRVIASALYKFVVGPGRDISVAPGPCSRYCANNVESDFFGSSFLAGLRSAGGSGNPDGVRKVTFCTHVYLRMTGFDQNEHSIRSTGNICNN